MLQQLMDYNRSFFSFILAAITKTSLRLFLIGVCLLVYRYLHLSNIYLHGIDIVSGCSDECSHKWKATNARTTYSYT